MPYFSHESSSLVRIQESGRTQFSKEIDSCPFNDDRFSYERKKRTYPRAAIVTFY